MLKSAVEERPRLREGVLGGGRRNGVHDGTECTGIRDFERRPSDMQELIELSTSPASACSPGHKHTFARIKVRASQNPLKDALSTCSHNQNASPVFSDNIQLRKRFLAIPLSTALTALPLASGVQAAYLEEGLLDVEAETLALMDMQTASPMMHVLTADLRTRLLSILDIASLLRCAAVSRDWRTLARCSEVWSLCCRQVSPSHDLPPPCPPPRTWC